MSARGSAGRWWAAVSLVAGLAISLSSGVARADGDPSAPPWLSWRTGDGTAECPSARAFADKVEQRLQASADEAARRQAVTIAVELARGPAALRGWRARLQVNRTGDGSAIGSRTLEQQDGSCESVADVVSFFATLVLSGAPAPLDGAEAAGVAPPVSPSGPGQPAPASSPLASHPVDPPSVQPPSTAPPASPA
ncbi:MAG TPA: hypothetical protein VIU64_21150, partial [Polyangia bacterium]